MDFQEDFWQEVPSSRAFVGVACGALTAWLAVKYLLKTPSPSPWPKTYDDTFEKTMVKTFGATLAFMPGFVWGVHWPVTLPLTATALGVCGLFELFDRSRQNVHKCDKCEKN
jgi:hypothetical protein